MRVFRVEHRSIKNYTTGHAAGPYGYFTEHDDISKVADTLANTHNSTNGHPGPYQDGLGDYVASDTVFGCPSYDITRQWFWGFLTRLRRVGFVASEYEVPAHYVRRGKSQRQLLFNIDKAQLVAHHALTK